MASGRNSFPEEWCLFSLQLVSWIFRLTRVAAGKDDAVEQLVVREGLKLNPRRDEIFWEDLFDFENCYFYQQVLKWQTYQASNQVLLNHICFP